MKHAIFALVSGGMILMVVLAIMTVHGRDLRQGELEEALSLSAKQALEGAVISGDTKVHDKDALSASFMQLFLNRIKGEEDPGLKVQVDILQADVKKGMLCVHAKEWYTHPDGRKGSCEATATYIVERESRKKSCQVSYYIPWDIARELGLDYVKGENTLYRRFAVSEGKKIKDPGVPPDVGKMHFTGWEAVDGITIGSVARTDVNYMAIYR
ncbi:MAG: hypothetical protein IIT72_00130 [Lachnospiraceae bacterium]|nr:hypothetical protein [Lachnospiraceae bacterium]MBQ2575836.1 hypothetical protein [Lachnospiraceae bacterium]MBQ5483883.1 hypothetical protein [Lachnospiraceae bacterium]